MYKYFLFIIFTILPAYSTSLDSTCDIAKIKEHIDLKFGQARVEVFPYPHIVIEDILPTDLYNELKKSLDEKLFHENIFDADHYGNIWQQFAEQITNQILKIKIVELFRPYSSYKFGVNISEKICCNTERIVDGHNIAEKYQIKPHIDQGYFFAQILLYFPNNEEDQSFDAGTRLLTHNSNYEALDVQYIPESEVQIAKVIPYKKNTLFTFMRTPNSWHSSFQPQGISRRFYGSGIYLTTQFLQTWYGSDFDLDRPLNERDVY